MPIDITFSAIFSSTFFPPASSSLDTFPLALATLDISALAKTRYIKTNLQRFTKFYIELFLQI